MDKTRIPLSAALEGYFIAAHARRLSPATLADYDNTFRKLEQFLGRDPPLADITAGDITAFLGSLDHLSAKTLLNYHTGLAALWTWATKEGIADQHIVRQVQRPKPEQREIMPYTRSDLQAMLTAVRAADEFLPHATGSASQLYRLRHQSSRQSGMGGEYPAWMAGWT